MAGTEARKLLTSLGMLSVPAFIYAADTIGSTKALSWLQSELVAGIIRGDFTPGHARAQEAAALSVLYPAGPGGRLR